MTRSATEVMQDVILSAVLDSITALKEASKGVPNALLRDLNAIHVNTAQADLPKELQAAIAASVRSAFTRLLKEGYSVAHADAPPPRPPQPRRVPDGQRRPPRSGGPDRPRPGGPDRTRPGGPDRTRPGGSDRTRPGGPDRKPRGPRKP